MNGAKGRTNLSVIKIEIVFMHGLGGNRKTSAMSRQRTDESGS